MLLKADLIFKDFSRKPSKFKYFSSLWNPVFGVTTLWHCHFKLGVKADLKITPHCNSNISYLSLVLLDLDIHVSYFKEEWIYLDQAKQEIKTFENGVDPDQLAP